MNLADKKNFDVAVVATFKHNPTAMVLHALPDGNCFLEDKKNAAENYARQQKSEVITVNREDYAEALGESKKAKSKKELDKEAKEKAEAEAKAIEEAEAKAKEEEEAKVLAEADAKAKADAEEAARAKAAGKEKK